ncbi:hypothetical protein E8E11_002876 [Didymella keratinophila]|nr:hypothetical protein E8E11_002876 [Didymella keratinophila]
MGDGTPKRTDKEVANTVGKNDGCIDDIIEEYDDCADALDEVELVADKDSSVTYPGENKARGLLKQERSNDKMAFALRAVTAAVDKLASSSRSEPEDENFEIIEKSKSGPEIDIDAVDEHKFKPPRTINTIKALPHPAMDLSAGMTDDEIADLSKVLTNTDRQSLLCFCAGNLMARSDIESDIEYDRTWYDIHKGLTVLVNCHDEWHELYKKTKGEVPLQQVLTRIMRNIEQMPIDWQLGFWRALETLHGTFDWMSHDEEAVFAEEYETSATIWFLETGLLEIALGWVQGRSPAELALAAEQAWLGKAEHSDEDWAALEKFAVSMRGWGREALTEFEGEDTI